MSEILKLPDDVRKTCIQLVRGYDRRCQEYKWKRIELTSTSVSNVITICDSDDPHNTDKQIGVMMPNSHNASRTTEDVIIRLQGLETSPETMRMRAVEYATQHVRIDLTDQLRQKLIYAIRKNCENWRKYPHKSLDVDFISERQFRREKNKFLFDIAFFMELV